MNKADRAIKQYIKNNPDVLLSNVIAEQCKDKEFRKLYEEQQLQTKIAIELMRLRKKRVLTQAQLAKRAQMPQANIARIERGEHVPTLGTLVRIFGALGEEVQLQIGRRSVCL